ncbi:MAG: hypothetical protein ABIH23_35155 [bacterium]
MKYLLGFLVVCLGTCLCGCVQTMQSVIDKKETPGERIKAFCIDFNWGSKGFAPPGMYAHASPKEHFEWYKDLGANTIQTFCVSCCGYAWFQSSVAPVQPGMKGDFLGELTKLGHGEGMKVMGYFCVGANTYWGQTHPDQSYGAPSAIHIPFTLDYLEYLSATIEDVLIKTGIDGFMIDWVFHPEQAQSVDTIAWMDCEKQMYRELLGKPFPGKEKISQEELDTFNRLATERCWRWIHDTAKRVKSDCIIWLTSHNLTRTESSGSAMLKEVDWVMNEHPDPTFLASIREGIGPHQQLIQCICGWGPQHDAAELLADPAMQNVGLYGFARPDPITTLPPSESKDPSLSGNAHNIFIIREAYRSE